MRQLVANLLPLVHASRHGFQCLRGYACIGIDAANAVVAACLKQQCTPLMGAALFAEYEAVLRRTALFEGCRLSADEREELRFPALKVVLPEDFLKELT